MKVELVEQTVGIAWEIFADQAILDHLRRFGGYRPFLNELPYPALGPLARKYPHTTQRQFYTRFAQLAGFPNAEGLGDLLVLLNNIPDRTMEVISTEGRLQSLADEVRRRTNQPSLPVRIITDEMDLRTARRKAALYLFWEDIGRSAYEVAKEAGLMYVSGAATGLAGWVSLDSEALLPGFTGHIGMGTHIYNYARRAASFTIVEEQMRGVGFVHGNPFIPLFEMFQTHWPLGELDGQFVTYRHTAPKRSTSF